MRDVAVRRHGTVRRLVLAVALAVAAALAVVGAAGPAAAQQAGPWRVTDYDVTITIRDDSSLQVVEDIAVDFDGDQRGIYRWWEVVEALPDPMPENSTIELDGDPTNYQRHIEIAVEGVTASANADTQVTRDGDRLQLRIGDPDEYFTGPQRYTISYRVAAAMNSFDDHDELYWDPIGSWGVPIEDLQVTVERPGIDQVACFSGSAGSTVSDCDAAATPAGATFDFGSLPPGAYPSIVVGMPPGTVDVAAPVIEPVPTFWSTVRDGLWGSPLAVLASVLVAVGGIGLALRRAWRAGRDMVRVGGVTAANDMAPGPEARRGLFDRPPVPVEFRPPGDLPPGLLGVIIDERVDPVDVSATIVDLARRGYLTIREVPAEGWFGKDDWELSRSPGADEAALTSWEAELYGGLFEDGLTVQVSELKGQFSGTYTQVRELLYDDATLRHRWFTGNPQTTRQRWAGLGGFLTVAGGVTAGVAFTSGFAGVGLGLVLTGIVVGILSSRAPARTSAGSDLLVRTLGFREFIATAEAGRMDFAEKEQIFADYLPYAVVFGVVERWAKTFADIGVDIGAAVGGYYYGSSVLDGRGLSQGLNSFSSFAGSAVSAAPPSSSGGGSGFSGGGFSGGGGGGGGGGAW